MNKDANISLVATLCTPNHQLYVVLYLRFILQKALLSIFTLKQNFQGRYKILGLNQYPGYDQHPGYEQDWKVTMPT